MAFKMTPKSPTLMATGKFASPLKQVANPGKVSKTDTAGKILPSKITPEMTARANKKRNTAVSKPKPEPKSPAKQAKVNREDGVQVKEVPAVVGEEVKKAGKFVGKEAKKVGKWFKKIGKKIGNANLTKTKEEKIKKKEEQLKKLKS